MEEKSRGGAEWIRTLLALEHAEPGDITPSTVEAIPSLLFNIQSVGVSEPPEPDQFVCFSLLDEDRALVPLIPLEEPSVEPPEELQLLLWVS